MSNSAELEKTVSPFENEQECDRSELAAQYAAFEESLTVYQTLRLYWRSILWVMYGLALVFGFGIDGNVAANLLAMPRFRVDYGKELDSGGVVSYIIPANWLSLFTGISQLCAIIGAFGAGWLADRIGRKYTALISCVISIGGVAAQFASHGSLGVLAAGKAINGIPTGMWLVIGPLYASETAPLKLRGVLIAMTNIVSLSGVLLFTGVVYQVGSSTTAAAYRIPLACQWIVPGLIILTAVFWPESPVWLVRMGKPEAAMKAIKQLYGSDKGRIDGEAVLAQIEETIERERRLSADKASYIECFAKGNRQNTLMSMFVYACQYLSGVVLVQGYQSYMYELLGYSSHEALLLGLLNIALQWIANVCSWFLIPTIGPRNLIVWGQLLAAISLFIIGGACTGSTQAANQVAVGFMFIWGVIYQLSVGAASWTVVGELPVLRLRSKTQALSNATLQFFQWLIGFVFPYMFNPDAGNLGGKVAFVFGGTTMVGFLVTFLFLPELRNPYKK
ncbi:general substrate transporter [Penicillium chermesinum]|uniref:General substrate transporter n=1 Tax=Penicillium chermesinum TaxID=63820 RepID=A0A9W9U0G9_9EURO|nr:general substrate transporter [Penicillium chermesinum]KAJ5249006.1 general substrate transporter [Penicillium chermesinum]